MEEKEIDLIDYLRIVKKRWLIIAAVLILSLLGASFLACLQKTIYVSSAVIKIGKIQDTYLADESDVINAIKSQNFLASVIGDIPWPESPPNWHSLEQAIAAEPFDNKKETHLVKIKAAWPDSRNAQAIVMAIGQKLINLHQEKFDAGMASQQSYLADLKNSIGSIKQEIDGMKKYLRQAEKGANLQAPEVILLQANIEGRERSLIERQREAHNLEMVLSPLNSGNTSYLSPPSLPEKPEKRNRGKIFILAMLGGLLLGALLAFFVEYLEVNKERLK